jgi:hypothetical protein
VTRETVVALVHRHPTGITTVDAAQELGVGVHVANQHLTRAALAGELAQRKAKKGYIWLPAGAKPAPVPPLGLDAARQARADAEATIDYNRRHLAALDAYIAAWEGA